MNYLQTLPPDLLRQTALNLPPEDVVNLILDKDLNKVLNDKFWEDKYNDDFRSLKKQSKDILNENIRNKYILKLLRKIDNEKTDLSNTLYDWRNEVGDLARENNWREILDFADKLRDIGEKLKVVTENEEKYKEILYQLRLQQFGFWPKYYEDKPNNPNEFDIAGIVVQIWYKGRWHELSNKYIDRLLSKLSINRKELSENDRSGLIYQIYLTEDLGDI